MLSGSWFHSLVVLGKNDFLNVVVRLTAVVCLLAFLRYLWVSCARVCGMRAEMWCGGKSVVQRHIIGRDLLCVYIHFCI